MKGSPLVPKPISRYHIRLIMRKASTSWLLILCALIASPSWGSEALPTLRKNIQEIEAARIAKTTSTAGLAKKLDQLSSQIDELKRRQAKDRNLIRQYRLESLLQEAHQLSKQVEQMGTELQLLSSKEFSARATLLAALDQEVDAKRTIANDKSEAYDKRRQAAQDLERLSMERMQQTLPEKNSDALPQSLQQVLSSSAPTDDMQDRVLVLRDFERRLQKDISSIEGELAETRRRRFLRTEVATLLEEESFFSEEGFIRSGTGKSKETEVASLGRTTAAPATPSRSGGTPTSTDPATSTGTPSISRSDNPLAAQPPLAPADASPSDTSDPLIHPGRDPLAQIAGGLATTKHRSREVGAGADASAVRVQWLQGRLNGTRKLLEDLQTRLRDLEQLSFR